jgi:hypothetical protein
LTVTLGGRGTDSSDDPDDVGKNAPIPMLNGKDPANAVSGAVAASNVNARVARRIGVRKGVFSLHAWSGHSMVRPLNSSYLEIIPRAMPQREVT